jgi:hypothetical protein
VKNSVYRETTLATWSDIVYISTDILNSTDITSYNFTVPENPSLGVYKGDEFYIGDSAHSSMTFGLLKYFNGTVFGWSEVLSCGDAGTISSDILQTLFIQNFTNCATPLSKLTCVMSSIAAAISKTFRESALTNAISAGYNATADSALNTANMATGQTFISATFVQVRWQWLSLPALIWVLAAVTMLSTAVMTQRADLQKWRNDVLPLLFLYREVSKDVDDGEEEKEGKGMGSSSSMAIATKAQSINARLVRRRGGTMLVET